LVFPDASTFFFRVESFGDLFKIHDFAFDNPWLARAWLAFLFLWLLLRRAMVLPFGLANNPRSARFFSFREFFEHDLFSVWAGRYNNSLSARLYQK